MKVDAELLVFETFLDTRGSFREWYHSYPPNFLPRQANCSISQKGVIRGIHSTKPDKSQSKIIACLKGSILDVVVNLRIGDENFGKFEIFELSSNESSSLLIGEHMGHGFLSLENDTIVTYLTDMEYSPENEISIDPLDPEIGIPWNQSNPILSSKDMNSLKLAQFKEKYGI